MIGSTGAVGSSVASVYSATARSLTDALTRIASGKKFQNASEDLLGFIRSRNLQSDIGGYEEVRQNLTAFKSYTTAAVEAGGSIYEALADMKKLAGQYDAAAGDDDAQAEYLADFNALKTQVSSTLQHTYVDGDLITTVVAGDDNIAEVNLDPAGTGRLEFNFTAIPDYADIEALDLTAAVAVGDPTVEETVDDMITSALTYLSEAKAFDGIVEQQLKLTDTVINSKQAVMSLITDIDDAAEMNNVLELSIRQQAAMSMMAQGNIVQNSLLKLYE